MLLWILLGVIVFVLIGAIIMAYTRGPQSKPVPPRPEVSPKADLGGKVGLEKLECQECGAVLDQDSISVKEGITFISCSHCNSSYQMFEES